MQRRSTTSVLLAGLFAVAWGTNVSTPLILRYQDRLGLSDTGAVGIFTVYVGGIMLALLFAGRLSDRFGRRPLVLPFTLLSAVASLILVPGRNSLALLLIGRFLLGAVSGAVLSVGTAWLVELQPPMASDSDRLKIGALAAALVYLGFGFGPLVSSLYEHWFPLPLVVPYVIHAVFTVAVVVAMVGIPETKPPDPHVSLVPRLGVPERARPTFRRFLAPSAVWVFGFPSISFALFPVILRDAIGDANDVLVAGLVGALTAGVGLFSRPLIRRIGDSRRALVIALWLGTVGYAVGVVAFLTPWWWIVPLAASLLGLASGTLMAAGLALTESVSDPAGRGALTATFYLRAYCGMAMPVIVTTVAGLLGLGPTLIVLTTVAATVAVLVTVRVGSFRPQHTALRAVDTDSAGRAEPAQQ